MRKLLMVLTTILISTGAYSAPFLSCDPVTDVGYAYMVDEGAWEVCGVDQGQAKCDLHSLPAGGHLLRMRAGNSVGESPGNSWMYVYKRYWGNWALYYILESAGDQLSWKLAHVEVVK